MFDSKQYNWADVNIFMMGKKVAGARGVKYKESIETEAVYGAGSQPLTIGAGNKSYDGEIKVLQSEIEAMQVAAGADSILDIQAIDIVVSYVPKSGGAIITDIIKSARFTEIEKGMSQGDKFMEISLPFVALGIQKQV